VHDDPPLDLGFSWPDGVAALDAEEQKQRTDADSETCILDGCRWFVRCVIAIEISDRSHELAERQRTGITMAAWVELVHLNLPSWSAIELEARSKRYTSTPRDRTAFALEWRPEGIRVEDAATSRWHDAEIMRRGLDREEALRHGRIGDVFELTDVMPDHGFDLVRLHARLRASQRSQSSLSATTCRPVTPG
jgi:hypothetical protein